MTKKRQTKPPHAPTDATRQTVQLHTMVGTTQADTARVLGIDEKTLRKYYRDELDLAKAKANATIGGALFNQAKSGDTSAMIFWLKTQAGWRERKDINHTSEDGSMSPKAAITAVDAIEAAKQYQKIMGKDE
jgi:type II secretory pathway component PulL